MIILYNYYIRKFLYQLFFINNNNFIILYYRNITILINEIIFNNKKYQSKKFKHICTYLV